VKAVVCWAPGDVRVEELDDPSPRAGEVKVAVVAVGVCHTDLNFTSGQVPVPYPIVLGHEAAGVVVECGDGVTAVRAGDHVICSIIGPCEHCFQCLRDDHALCEEAPFFTGTMLDGTTRLSQGDTPIHTLHYQGSYAEYAIVPERFVVPVRTTPRSTWCAGWHVAWPPGSARRWCGRRSRPARAWWWSARAAWVWPR
jgi:S-(hydroxymethyl)glutathione dehydrogenase/alcohol dehydrogenase